MNLQDNNTTNLEVNNQNDGRKMMSKETLDFMELILLKSIDSKSYDDLLFLRMYLSKTEFIRKNLPNITAKQTDDLCRHLSYENYNQGDVVFRQGEDGDKVYIILSGSVDITMKYTVDIGNGESEVRDKFIRTMYDGEYFGERALNYDEPRSATAICTSITHLISIHKDIYLSVQVDSDQNTDKTVSYQPGTKEYVFQVLSKARHQRSTEEISIVAAYLDRRVPFFQKFTTEQRIELCRVVDLVSIIGRTVLFKQGSIGQAFYVVLTGFVEIWVNSVDKPTAAPVDATLSRQTSPQAPSPLHLKRQSHLFDGLGERVNQLNPGDVFGERALENGSSIRMGSVVTCDDITDLIVISKEDYINLVSFMMHSDIMEKIVVLRKTPLFQNVEGVHLRSLAGYMFLRQFRLDQVICKAGDKMNDIIIIAAGELKAEMEVEPIIPSHAIKSSTLYLKDTGKQIVNLGRIAPFSVLGTDLMLLDSILDEIFYKESVITTSFVKCYVIAKVDYLVHLPVESKIALSNTVRQFVYPLLPQLWENAPRIIGEKDWKINKAWTQFKQDMLEHKNNTSLVKHYRAVADVHLNTKLISPRLAKSNNSYNLSLNNNRSTILNHNISSTIVTSDWGTPAALAREKEMRKVTSSSSLNSSSVSKAKHNHYKFEDNTFVLKAIDIGKRRDNKRNELILGFGQKNGSIQLPPLQTFNQKANENELESNSTKKTNNSHINSNQLEQHPFAVIQYHREPVHSRDSSNNHFNYNYSSTNISLKHMVRCHMRLCGTVTSCQASKDLALLILKNVYITLYNSDLSKEEEINLTWRVFNGFESIPLQNTDHFIIYCKNSPVEYASYTPTKNLLLHEFPATCKAKSQRFACVLAKEISMFTVKPNTSNQSLTSSNNDLMMKKSSSLKPLFVSEISSIVEVSAVFLTQLDCLRFCVIDEEMTNYIKANNKYNYNNNIFDNPYIQQKRLNLNNHIKQYNIMNPSDKLLLCVFPLYEWIVVDQDSLDMSSAMKTIDYSKVGKLVDVKLSKYVDSFNDEVTKELQTALKESGLLPSNSQISRTSNKDVSRTVIEQNLIAPNISIKMLEREVYRKELVKQVNKCINSDTVIDEKLSSNINSNNEEINNKMINQSDDELENILSKLNAMKQITLKRKEIINSNDSLCHKEISLLNAFNHYRKNSLPIQQIQYDNNSSNYEIRQTIEDATKNSNIFQLEKEISEGLGLIMERESMHQTLLNAPNMNEIINEINELKIKENNIKTNKNLINNNNNMKLKQSIQFELMNKLTALQSILDKIHESNSSITQKS